MTPVDFLKKELSALAECTKYVGQAYIRTRIEVIIDMMKEEVETIERERSCSCSSTVASSDYPH